MIESGFEPKSVDPQIWTHVFTSGGRWLGESLMCGLYFDRLISTYEIYDSRTGENKKSLCA